MTETTRKNRGATLTAATINRWLHFLAPVYSLSVAPILYFCIGQLNALPEPQALKLISDPAGATQLAREMKFHLDEHPELTLFRDHWYFDMIYESVVAPKENDAMTYETRMQLLATGYRDVFETHEEILRYLTLAASAGLFFSISVWFAPNFFSYSGLCISSLALTPPVSSLLTGRHPGQLFVYSLPFIMLALAMTTSALAAYVARGLQGHPERQKGWTKIAWGTGALLIGTGIVVWIIVDLQEARYQTGTAAGLLVVYGIRGIVIGLKIIVADRKQRLEKQPHETQSPAA